MFETETPYTLRRATSSDAEMLSQIGIATFVETYTALIDGPAMTAHCAAHHSAAAYTVHLADKDTAAWLIAHRSTGAPMGYALACPPDLPVPIEAGDVELKRIYLLSRFQGRGAAQAMMHTVLDWARERGAPRVLLGTYEGNDRAAAFYRKHGFELIGTRQFDVGGIIYDDIVLGRAL
ncbi:MAG: GNAT family N-acetyltransferase [Pseudomonadota bacterium]